MAFYFANLDLKTRVYMILEIELDASSGTLYLSPRLRPGREDQYIAYLRDAARAHNESWLAAQIRAHGLLRPEEQRMSANNRMVTTRVPATAPDTLAATEFNRYYARGICARAIDSGMLHVEICRGKDVPQLRPESESVIGKRFAAESLLQHLRASHGVEPALGLPPRPHSGVTVRLVT